MARVAWLLVLCAVVAVTAQPAGAIVFRTGDTVTVQAGEVIDDDLIAAASTLRIDGKVNGDIIAAGDTIQVSGPVTGSVMVAGSKVDVTGKVTGSVRAAGESVSVSGSVGRNVAVAGNNVALAAGGGVARDFYAAGNVVDVDGPVGRNVGAAGTTANLRGRVGGRVTFEGTNLVLDPTAQIKGDVVYRAPNAAKIASGAVIGGALRHLTPRPKGPSPLVVLAPWFYLFSVIASYLVGIVGLAVAPRVFAASGYSMYSRAWWNLVLGVLVLVLAPVAMFIVGITIVGLPLAAVMFEFWLFFILFAGLPVALFLGDWILTRATRHAVSPYLALLLGLVVLLALAIVPVFGYVVRAFALLFGLGAYARAVKGALVELRRPTAAQPAA